MLPRLIWILSLLLLLAQPVLGRQLSSRAEISLLTIDPGADLYSAFGHTAIWVSDPLAGVNTVYNYGTFDFSSGSNYDFYLNFSMGRLNYRLEVETYREFDYVYHYFQRSYKAQVLNLDQEQKQAVYDFLEYNYLPENRYYLYEFFYDNCATRVRDLFTEVLGDSVLQWQQPHESMDASFRDLLWEYLQDRRWVGFGIDIALGAVVDEPITPWMSMFLPDYLAIEIDKTTVITPDGPEPLVAETRNLFEGTSVVHREPWYISPIFVFWMLFLLVAGVTYLGWRKKRLLRIVDFWVFFLSGFSGLVILLLWTATIHTAVVQNWNLMWLWPTHLVLAFFLIRRPAPWVRYYFMAATLATGMTILGWFFIPQEFHPGFLPWMLMLGLRSAYLARMLNPRTRTVDAD